MSTAPAFAIGRRVKLATRADAIVPMPLERWISEGRGEDRALTQPKFSFAAPNTPMNYGPPRRMRKPFIERPSRIATVRDMQEYNACCVLASGLVSFGVTRHMEAFKQLSSPADLQKLHYAAETALRVNA